MALTQKRTKLEDTNSEETTAEVSADEEARTTSPTSDSGSAENADIATKESNNSCANVVSETTTQQPPPPPPPGPMPQYSYTREELMKIGKSDQSNKRPPCLDTAFDNAIGLWDPERWFLGKRRSESPQSSSDVDVKTKQRVVEIERETFKRRSSSDPKERLKEEQQDNIVLSPQRRSFGTGCHVSQQTSSSASRRPESPADLRGNDRDRDLHRDSSRRIGSGRIVTRDRGDGRPEREFSFSRSSTERRGSERDRDRYDREDRDLRFSSSSSGRSGSSREFGSDRKSGGRGRNRRIEEEEPEWFSSGPTSQSETIELHGFDDIPEEEGGGCDDKADNEKEDVEPKGKRRRRSSSWRKSTKTMMEEDGIPEEDEKEGEEDGSGDKKTSRNSSRPGSSASKEMTTTEGGDARGRKTPEGTRDGTCLTPTREFDVNKLFEMDSIGFLSNGTPPDTSRGLGGSRFSQWFRSDSPNFGIGSDGNSRRSSLQDELVGNLINELEPGIMIPSPQTGNDNNAYFAPISPAQTSDGSKKILDLLHGASGAPYPQQPQHHHPHHHPHHDGFKNTPSAQELAMSGRACNVQELEAGLKQLVLGHHRLEDSAVPNGPAPPSSCRPATADEEMPAFKKLLAQISEGQVVASSQQGISLGPIDKSRVLQEKDVVQMMAKPPLQQQQHQLVPPRGDNMAQQQQVQQHHSPMHYAAANKNANLMNILKNAPTEQDILAGHVKGQMPPTQLQHQQQQQAQNAAYPDILLRFLQQQQQQQQPPPQPNAQENPLAKLMAPNSAIRPRSPGTQDVMNKRPINSVDMHAYHSGLANGQMSRQQQVVQQMQQSKALQQQQREILASIAKQQQQQQQQLHQAAAVVASAQLQPTIIQQPASPPAPLQLQQGLNRTLSPRPTSPHGHPADSIQQALFQQQQARIPSPLVFGQTPPLLSHAPSPIHPSPVVAPPMGPSLNPNSLQVYNNQMMQRVPSPQELVLHTQQIMQNALIKSKLEEQKENYRKRQEKQRTRSPNMLGSKPNEGSPSKIPGLSPTMAAFTPTSVMRKMQAEKEKDGGVKMDVSSPPSMAPKLHGSLEPKSLAQQVGNGISLMDFDKMPRPLHGQGLMHSQMPMRGPVVTASGQPGRAIVKGGPPLDHVSVLGNKGGVGEWSNNVFEGMQNQKVMNPTQPSPMINVPGAKNANTFDMAKLMEQQRLLHNSQQQRLGNTPTMSSSMSHTNFPVRGGGNIHPNVPPRSNVNIPPTNMLLRNVVHPNVNPAVRAQLNLALIQQRMMDPHQLQQQASRIHPVTLQQLMLGNSAAAPRSQVPNMNLHDCSRLSESQQPFYSMMGNMSAPNNNNNMTGSSTGGGLGLGATGAAGANRHSPINNLAQWFNSDALKQKLPDLPPVPTKKALSLEEVERQQQQPQVHI